MNVVLVFHEGCFEMVADETWSEPEVARVYARGVEQGGTCYDSQLIAYVYPADEQRMRDEHRLFPSALKKGIREAKARLG